VDTATSASGAEQGSASNATPQHRSAVGKSKSKSGWTNGTPHAGYKCGKCGGTDHYLNKCPTKKGSSGGRGGGSSRGSVGGDNGGGSGDGANTKPDIAPQHTPQNKDDKGVTNKDIVYYSLCNAPLIEIKRFGTVQARALICVDAISFRSRSDGGAGALCTIYSALTNSHSMRCSY
jgi:hypothetical protein